MSIHFHKDDRVARITIDRPPLNVLNIVTLRELKKVLDTVGNDPSLHVLVLRGAGERAFSAGVDVKDHTPEQVPEMLEVVHGVIRKLFALPQVTIAAIRGLCLGGGCEIASSCDLLLATTGSLFATPEINVGCYPPVALARFPSHLGYHRAAEMILTGRRISADEAYTIGLVNRVVPDDDLDPGVEELLKDFQGKSGAVLRITLRGLRELSLKNFSESLKRSEELYLKDLLKTEDVEEGVKAFLEKRKPTWKHR